MQQVKSEAFYAGAHVVDARALPVPVRTPRALIANRLNRAFVLHGTKIRRALMLAAVLAGAVALYEVREPIFGLANGLGGVAQGELADAGLAIGEIFITGQSLTDEQAIFDALGIQPGTPTFGFDVAAARERIAALPAIERVSVRKSLPGDVAVVVAEKVPVARWTVDGVSLVIDGAGEAIGVAGSGFRDLPHVIGDGAADNALAMIRALDNVPQLKQGLLAISRIADRRWDLIYDTGLRVQLPEQGVSQALRRLITYQNDYQLLDRDISLIDLRVDTVVAVRPTPSPDTDKT